MSLSFSIARRLYSTPDKTKKVSNPAIKIAMAGIAIGIAVMVISVAVVFGFKHTIKDKVVGFGSHITVGNFLSMHGFEQAPVVMGDSMIKVIQNIEGVESVSPYAVTQGILKTDDDFLGVQLKGLDKSYNANFLKQNIVDGKLPSFLANNEKTDRSTNRQTDKSKNRKTEESDEAEGSKKELLISRKQADKLQVKAGDRIFAYFIKGENVRARRFTISGIYQTNISAFDDFVCFTDLKTTQKLNEYKADETDGAEVIVKDFTKLDEVAERFVMKINRTADRNEETYSSRTVLDTYPGIFQWLDVLDLNVWIILGLMVAVAGFTMISGLLIIILERTSMIGLLKALGMRNSAVRHTFIWLAMLIVCKGLLIGNALAFALMYLQKFTGIIKLDPSVYFVSEVPLEINLPVILLINLATLFLCTLILILPSMLVSHISLAKVMRYE